MIYNVISKCTIGMLSGNKLEITISLMGVYTFFFYKHNVYKHRKAQKRPKIKHFAKHMPSLSLKDVQRHCF